MKIIKEGFGENWTMQVKCEAITDELGYVRDGKKEHCGSILEINKDDISRKEWDKYPDISGVDYIVTCPKCHCQIEIPKKDLPDWVVERVDLKAKNGPNSLPDLSVSVMDEVNAKSAS